MALLVNGTHGTPLNRRQSTIDEGRCPHALTLPLTTNVSRRERSIFSEPLFEAISPYRTRNTPLIPRALPHFCNLLYSFCCFFIVSALSKLVPRSINIRSDGKISGRFGWGIAPTITSGQTELTGGSSHNSNYAEPPCIESLLQMPEGGIIAKGDKRKLFLQLEGGSTLAQ